MKSLLPLLVLSVSLSAAPKYHLQMEANPAAPFPFLSKFGNVKLDVYPDGVRAETLWLNGFARRGNRSVTIMNPLGRMYTEVPIDHIAGLVRKMSGQKSDIGIAVRMEPVIAGSVKGLAAHRHRLSYGVNAWIDVWTGDSLPDNQPLREVVLQFTRGISTATAEALAAIPGTPVYVEINFSHYRKVPILRLQSFSTDVSTANDDLSVGSFYVKAPVIDALWK